jgi:hypothetical protein
MKWDPTSKVILRVLSVYVVKIVHPVMFKITETPETKNPTKVKEKGHL